MLRIFRRFKVVKKMNTHTLSNILTIKNDRQYILFDIIGRMKVLLEFFKRNPKYKNLVPFLKTYFLITKSVAERQVEYKVYFDHPDKLQQLDAYFANLYFRPLKAFLLHGKILTPWRCYFQYCQRSDGIPFVQMLLGINAHINSDLLTSVTKLRYNERHDFLRINKILSEEIPDVMKFLVRVDHDLLGLGALIFREFVNREFQNVIVNWREIVWKNSKKLSIVKYKQIVKQVHYQTESTGEEIIEVFEDLTHYRHLTKLVSKMNGLGVKLKL